jgi:hypothetical protein
MEKTKGHATIQDLPQIHISIPSGICQAYWLFIGTIALGVLIFLKMETRSADFSVYDVVYWSNVLAMIIVRFVDAVWLKGSTLKGEPATIVDWRKYSLSLLFLAITLWLAIHVLAMIIFG